MTPEYTHLIQDGRQIVQAVTNMDSNGRDAEVSMCVQLEV